MRFPLFHLRFLIVPVSAIFVVAWSGEGVPVLAQDVPAAAGTTTNTFRVDLPTTLRLAGAQNLDIQIAHQKLAEAKAVHEKALEQFFPWLSPGIAYHRRDGMTQSVPSGAVVDTDFHSYAAGGFVAAQVDVGNAIFQTLEARQLAMAAGHSLQARNEDSLLAAAKGYFDLAKAQALAGVAEDTLRISRDYQNQLHGAVAAGLAFKGDELRVQTQTKQSQLLLRQAQERQRVAAARLAEILHLDGTVELVPQPSELVPMEFQKADAPLTSLVQQALVARPELKQSQAFITAAREAKNGAAYGPMIPALGAQAWFGGFGGGHDGQPDNFGSAQDYLATLSWRIGPGGLFDPARRHAANARLASANLEREKTEDQITRQVVESATRLRSQFDQMETARQALESAQEALHLAVQRKEFGVGVVLENIQSQQDLARARNDYLNAIAEFDKAQYELSRAVGILPVSK